LAPARLMRGSHDRSWKKAVGLPTWGQLPAAHLRQGKRMKDLGDLVWVRANQGAPNIRTRDVGHEHNIVGWMGGRWRNGIGLSGGQYGDRHNQLPEPIH
jgi:hypothetical protein